MSYIGCCVGKAGGHYAGVGDAGTLKGNVFSGLAGDLKRTQLAKTKATTTAKGSAASTTQLYMSAGQLVGLSTYAQVAKASADPGFKAWLDSYIAAMRAGTTAPAPTAAAKQVAANVAGKSSGGVALPGAGSGGGLSFLSNIPKPALIAGAVAVVGAIGYAVVSSGSGSSSAE